MGDENSSETRNLCKFLLVLSSELKLPVSLFVRKLFSCRLRQGEKARPELSIILRFECPILGLELSLWLKAVRIFPRCGVKRESELGPVQAPSFYVQFESDLMCFLNTMNSSEKSYMLIEGSRFVFGAINKVPI